jgi:hypothetical protein
VTIRLNVSLAVERERGASLPSRSAALERAVANPVPSDIVRVRSYLLLVDVREAPHVHLGVGAAVVRGLES